jgi:hypothetical protein
MEPSEYPTRTSNSHAYYYPAVPVSMNAATLEIRQR